MELPSCLLLVHYCAVTNVFLAIASIAVIQKTATIKWAIMMKDAIRTMVKLIPQGKQRLSQKPKNAVLIEDY